MMLDKNPEIIFNDIQKEFKKNVIPVTVGQLLSRTKFLHQLVYL